MNRVLLIEDNPLNQAVIEDMFIFDEIPAQLVCAGTAEEGLEMLSQITPVLVLMDIRLPGIDGLEATRRIKADPATQNIPVWAITAHAMKGDKESALEAGCTAYVAKPIDSRKLAENLREFLSQLPASASNPSEVSSNG